ncbi:mitochondrial carrier [Myriangium duriaei CBS 260.36]|uniref:Mitochondrial thiamine pyrophosphate carrier 1 n=1 Tax=Myriangium duriaei CBS 260.36 TaxID=1168546 RepID=A0A9P4MJW4_9PEZI|nr:mitochondrial carrier [Myriangium duriaei CBS 260.36]
MTSIAAQGDRGSPASTSVDVNLPLEPRKQVKTIDKKSPEYITRNFIAGGLAGCAAKTVVGPLDRVKILFQASNPQFQKYTGSWFGVVKAIRDIYSSAGTRGLFRGHSATLVRIFPYAGVKFLAYEQVRAIIIRDASQETPLRRFTTGSIAGMISVLATYPLEVIRVRMAWETKAHTRSSYLDICRRIYHENPGASRTGIANFFRGFTPTMWGMLPYAGSSFLAHDMAGDFMRHPSLAQYTILPHSERRSKDPRKPPQLKYWAELSTGAFAGFVSQTVSYPLEVIRRRMQVGGVVGDGHRLGMVEVARTIWRQAGVKGFYVGLGIGYAKVVPMTSVSFFAYERAKYYLGI